MFQDFFFERRTSGTGFAKSLNGHALESGNEFLLSFADRSTIHSKLFAQERIASASEDHREESEDVSSLLFVQAFQ